MAKRLRQISRPTGRPVEVTGTDLDMSVVHMPDGRTMQRTLMGMSRENVERMRQGYICVKCLEDLDAPFPEECPICKFPMREQQSAEFAKDFRGEVRLGPSTTLDEEREIMNEIREERQRERLRALGVNIVKPQIIVPRDI